MDGVKLLDLESRGCFNYFWDRVNKDPKSPGYGLILDRTGDTEIASIAAVGFGLSAIVIGIERGWIGRQEGYDRTLGTLHTLLNNAQNYRGFYAHFLDIKTGKRLGNSEYSTIDTAILLNGVITAGQYFGGTIKELATKLYERTDWCFIVNKKKKWFYMHYWPEIYPKEHSGLGGHWDYFAEQLMMYILAAGSPTSYVGPKLYYNMGKLIGDHGGEIFIRGWHNALFIHQFSHAWLDTAKYIDRDGINWFQNSVKATLSNRKYCTDNPEGFKTYSSKDWGLTACTGPTGYSGRYGTLPSGLVEEVNHNDGTVPVCGPLGSMPFTPKESMEFLLHIYETYPKLWGKYGFYDSYNLEGDEPWFCEDYIGINKGITLLMIENYRTGLIWELYMKNEYIQEGLKNLLFRKWEDLGGAHSVA